MTQFVHYIHLLYAPRAISLWHLSPSNTERVGGRITNCGICEPWIWIFSAKKWRHWIATPIPGNWSLPCTKHSQRYKVLASLSLLPSALTASPIRCLHWICYLGHSAAGSDELGVCFDFTLGKASGMEQPAQKTARALCKTSSIRHPQELSRHPRE